MKIKDIEWRKSPTGSDVGYMGKFQLFEIYVDKVQSEERFKEHPYKLLTQLPQMKKVWGDDVEKLKEASKHMIQLFISHVELKE